MEDFFQVLLVLGFVIISIVFNGKKKKAQATGEVFPPIDSEEEELPQQEIPEVPQKSSIPLTEVITPKHQQQNKISRNRRIKVEQPANCVQPIKKSAMEEQTTMSHINLRSPQKAREAFIYSEIFKRKYE